MIRATLFDLDDTLYPESAWLAGAWDAVARRAGSFGVPETAFRAALDDLAANGSEPGPVINRALTRVEAVAPIDQLVSAFRSHAPSHLEPYPGVRTALAKLAGHGVGLGIVTDGGTDIQRAKVAALGLDVDAVTYSDETGREHRKPDPVPFLRALRELGISAGDTAFVGDRPGTDVIGSASVGMRAIRVHTGAWAHEPDVAATWASVPDVATACELVIAELATPDLSRA